MKTIASLIVSLLLSATAEAQQTFIELGGTRSPQGDHALAWGISGFALTTANAEDAIRNENSDLFENYLIDTASGTILATLPTTYFATSNSQKITAVS